MAIYRDVFQERAARQAERATEAVAAPPAEPVNRNPHGYTSEGAMASGDDLPFVPSFVERGLNYVQRGMDRWSTTLIQDPLRVLRYQSWARWARSEGIVGKEFDERSRAWKQNVFGDPEFEYNIQRLWRDVTPGDGVDEVYRRGMSFGQMGAVQQYGVFDFSDTRRVAWAMGQDGFSFRSGMADALLRLTTDADVLLGPAAVAAKVRTVDQPIRSQQDLFRFLGSAKWAKRQDQMQRLHEAGDKAAFNKIFRGDADLAELMWQAETPDVRELLFRYYSGFDERALALLATRQANLLDLMAQVDDERKLIEDLLAGRVVGRGAGPGQPPAAGAAPPPPATPGGPGAPQPTPGLPGAPAAGLPAGPPPLPGELNRGPLVMGPGDSQWEFVGEVDEAAAGPFEMPPGENPLTVKPSDKVGNERAPRGHSPFMLASVRDEWFRADVLRRPGFVQKWESIANEAFDVRRVRAGDDEYINEMLKRKGGYPVPRDRRIWNRWNTITTKMQSYADFQISTLWMQRNTRYKRDLAAFWKRLGLNPDDDIMVYRGMTDHNFARSPEEFSIMNFALDPSVPDQFGARPKPRDYAHFEPGQSVSTRRVHGWDDRDVAYANVYAFKVKVRDIIGLGYPGEFEVFIDLHRARPVFKKVESQADIFNASVAASASPASRFGPGEGVLPLDRVRAVEAFKGLHAKYPFLGPFRDTWATEAVVRDAAKRVGLSVNVTRLQALERSAGDADNLSALTLELNKLAEGVREQYDDWNNLPWLGGAAEGGADPYALTKMQEDVELADGYDALTYGLPAAGEILNEAPWLLDVALKAGLAFEDEATVLAHILRVVEKAGNPWPGPATPERITDLIDLNPQWAREMQEYALQGRLYDEAGEAFPGGLAADKSAEANRTGRWLPEPQWADEVDTIHVPSEAEVLNAAGEMLSDPSYGPMFGGGAGALPPGGSVPPAGAGAPPGGGGGLAPAAGGGGAMEPHWTNKLRHRLADLQTIAEVTQGDLAFYRRLFDSRTNGAGLHAFIHQTPSGFQAARAVAAHSALKVPLLQRDFTLQSGPFGAVWHFVGRMASLTPPSMMHAEDSRQSVQTVERLVKRSHLTDERRRYWIGQMMAADSAERRLQVLEEAEDAVIRAAVRQAKDAPGDAAVVDELLKTWRGSKGRARDYISGREYDAAGRGYVTIPRAIWDGKGVVRSSHGDMITIAMPNHITQSANLVPVLNMRHLDQILTRRGRWFNTNQKGFFIKNTLEQAETVWKANVLLRPAFLTRLMLLDEGLRTVAKVVAIGQLDARYFGQIRDGIHNTLVEEMGLKDGAAAKIIRKVLPDIPGLRWVNGEIRRPGETSIEGMRIPGIWGSKGDQAELLQQQLFSRKGIDALLGVGENVAKEKLRGYTSTGKYKTLRPDDPTHMDQWVHVLNNEIGQDYLLRLILQGHDNDLIAAKLRTEADGLDYMNRFNRRAGNWMKPEELHPWIDELREKINDYTGNIDSLKRQILNRKVTAQELETLFPRVMDRPLIHGAHFEQALLKGPWDVLMEAVDNGYQRIVGLPLDRILREPLADAVFRAELELQLKAHLDAFGQVTQADLKTAIEAARRHAVREVGETLVNLGSQTRLTEMLSTLMPFIGPWEESLARWAGIMAERPDFFAYARLAWYAPEASGMIRTDDRGTEYLVFPTLPGMDKIPFFGEAFKYGGKWAINKEHLNMVLNAPGFGPFVSIAVNAIARHNVDFAEAVKFVLPYGPQDWKNLLLSGGEKRIQSLQDTSNRSFVYDWKQLWEQEMIKYDVGLRETKPTQEEMIDAAKAIQRVKLVATLFGPASMQFQSEFQPYIDTFREMVAEEGDYQAASARFTELYGEDVVRITTHMTRNNAGVVPSLAAWEKYQNHPEIHGNKQLARLVTGGGGTSQEYEFSRAVYYRMQQQETVPGSGVKMLEPLSLSEIAEAGEVEQGWYEFRRIDQAYQAMLDKLGLKGTETMAGPLRQMRTEQIETLRDANQAWANDYDSFDARESDKFMRAVDVLFTQDPNLRRRPDLNGLGEFLDAYKAFVPELARRQAMGLSGTLEGNDDLALAWDAIIAEMRIQNPDFDDLYPRYLDRVSPTWKGY